MSKKFENSSPVTVDMKKGMSLFFIRHPDTTKNKNDDERVPTTAGILATKIVSNILKESGMVPDVVIVSPAIRAIIGAVIMFGQKEINIIIYDDLYNFKQFPKMDKLYNSGITDPRKYINADFRKVGGFQNKYIKFLRENNYYRENIFIACVSHAMITNFLAIMFAKENILFETMLPGSGGFLIEKKDSEKPHVRLITAHN